MATHATGGPPGEPEECRIRIAAAGDMHYGGAHDRDRAKAAFASLAGRTDLVLLAGDLTTHGEPEQAAILAEAAGEAGAPVVAVLGNHDWHSNRAGEVAAVLEGAGAAGRHPSPPHAGTFAGKVGEVPVYNVSVPVMGEDWWVFEMSGARRVPSEVH